MMALSKTSFDEVIKVYPELHGKIARRAEIQLQELLTHARTRSMKEAPHPAGGLHRSHTKAKAHA